MHWTGFTTLQLLQQHQLKDKLKFAAHYLFKSADFPTFHFNQKPRAQNFESK